MYELTGKIRCFCDLTAHAVEVVAAAPTAEELKGTLEGTEDGEIPF